MKKIILTIILTISIILTGCSIANTPTAKVEDLLSDYQKLEDNIAINYSDLAIDDDLSLDLQNEYNDLIKDQYQGISYEIKEEIIDGDTATVTTSIKVKDYKEIINKYNKNDYQKDKYHEIIIDDLKDAKNMVTYTIDFTLTKDNEDNWQLDDLTNEMEEKLLGIN